MLTKNDIIIEDSLFPESDIIDYEKQISDLLSLINDLISEFNIRTLKKIIIKNNVLISKEQGRAVFDGIQMQSRIELGRITFCQFNNSNLSNPQEQCCALATICHEVCHIYDKENCVKALSGRIPDELFDVFKLGIQNWSEYLAYYLTCKIYADKGVIKDYNKVISCMEQRHSDDDIKMLYYFTSKMIAFYTNKECKLYHNIAIGHFIYTNKYCEDITKILLNIYDKYPDHIYINDFIQLGQAYHKYGKSLIPLKENE